MTDPVQSLVLAQVSVPVIAPVVTLETGQARDLVLVLVLDSVIAPVLKLETGQAPDLQLDLVKDPAIAATSAPVKVLEVESMIARSG
jgi:hypothetical protein